MFQFLVKKICASFVSARVDKVALEPEGTAPERIQVWGAFALARKEDRNTYDSAQRGYLYFSCKPGKELICRKEWADLKQAVRLNGGNNPSILNL
jgi:hypothetical protein